jgi:uncharacterized protein YigE (DUF2233 family)
MRGAAAIVALAFWGVSPAVQAAAPIDCQNVTYAENRYAVCHVDLRAAEAAGGELRLFLYDDDGDPLGHFSTLENYLADQGKQLLFAMNAGMYHSDRSPVGHYIEDGEQIMRVIENAGPGNFGLLPNGVFCIRGHHAQVMETLSYNTNSAPCDYATQSGPMLVIDGDLHPKFLPHSTSRYIRNGVGTSDDGSIATFVMSRNLITFHEFGTFFRDHLNLNSALYLDGNISRMFAPQLGRDDFGFQMGPMIGLLIDNNP